MDVPGQAQQMFGKLCAGNARGDGPELAANFGRGRRLHVPHVELARPAVEEDQNTRVGRGMQFRVRRVLLRAQHSRQAEPESADAADLQHAASGNLRTGTRKLLHAPPPHQSDWRLPLLCALVPIMSNVEARMTKEARMTNAKEAGDEVRYDSIRDSDVVILS